MDLQHTDGVESNVEDEGNCSGMNDELDKNVDAEEDFEFCYNCHSWEHNTKACTIELCKIGIVDGVQVGCGKQGHTRVQCPTKPLPASTTTTMPNVNTSKMPKVNDKIPELVVSPPTSIVLNFFCSEFNDL